MYPKENSAASSSIKVEADSKSAKNVTTSSQAGYQVLDARKLAYNDTGYSPAGISQQMGSLLEQSHQTQKLLSVLDTLANVSDSAGGYVQLRPEYRFCPVLIGSDNQAIPLYEFVEVIDGLVDYEGIREAFPNLSYAQIHGAISFLRKLAQFNASGIDMDDLEDESITEDEALMDELKRALADQEITRVLNLNKRDL